MPTVLNANCPQVERTALETLNLGLRQAAGRVKLACSFSLEDTVIIDLVQRFDLPVGVFAIDTGRLPEETYIVAESVRDRYGIEIAWYFPQAQQVEDLERAHGLFSFRDSLAARQSCCGIRKVEPLRRALQGLSGWVTGMRREQSATRGALLPVGPDRENAGLVKINPLYAWTLQDLWDYAERYRIPVHPLHRRGFPSIGCAPCTRAVGEGEDVRAGRWWWETPEHKECGMHRRG